MYRYILVDYIEWFQSIEFDYGLQTLISIYRRRYWSTCSSSLRLRPHPDIPQIVSWSPPMMGAQKLNNCFVQDLCVFFTVLYLTLQYLTWFPPTIQGVFLWINIGYCIYTACMQCHIFYQIMWSKLLKTNLPIKHI